MRVQTTRRFASHARCGPAGASLRRARRGLRHTSEAAFGPPRFVPGFAGSSLWWAPSGTSDQQVLKGVVYADAAGWYDLPLPSALSLSAGSYWIGVITGGRAGWRASGGTASLFAEYTP